MPVAVTATAITTGWAAKTQRSGRPRRARKPKIPTSRLQPTCMLGIAAYGLNGTTPPNEPVSWPLARPTVSAMPISGTSRGGAIGSRA